jgi:hypothetical protein
VTQGQRVAGEQLIPEKSAQTYLAVIVQGGFSLKKKTTEGTASGVRQLENRYRPSIYEQFIERLRLY